MENRIIVISRHFGSGNRTIGKRAADQPRTLQEKIILDLAGKGPCVIVGRCLHCPFNNPQLSL